MKRLLYRFKGFKKKTQQNKEFKHSLFTHWEIRKVQTHKRKSVVKDASLFYIYSHYEIFHRLCEIQTQKSLTFTYINHSYKIMTTLLKIITDW